MLDESPCERAQRLRDLREALITGQAVTETRFGEDMVRFGPANLPALEREIVAADAACALSLGQAPTRRRRYAMGARFRPY